MDAHILLEGLADGVLVVAVDGERIVGLNRTMAAWLGQSPSSLIGAPLAVLLADAEVLGLVGLATAFGAQREAHMQVLFVDRGGEYLSTWVSGSRVSDPEGSGDCFVLVCRQDTAVHDLLNESTRWAAQLSEKADLLETARRDAERREQATAALSQQQKLESIGRLAAGIAHEINTPVQFIGDNVTFLRKAFDRLWPLIERQQAAANDGQALDPKELAALLRAAKVTFLAREIPRAVEQTLEGVTRVSKIVRAMKEFSHPSSAERQPSDLNQAIESTVTVARNEWKYVADLQLELDPTLPPVPCHVDEINQVILNMVINSAHAIEEARGSAEAPLGTIRIRTRHTADAALVEVSDTGAGIAPEHLEKIFDLFFTTKEVGRGTGQGLSLAYNVVHRRHGGRIEVQSQRGEGTRFTLHLPLAEALQPVSAA